MSRTILITGGINGGTRRFAEQIAELQGPPVLLVRTHGHLADAFGGEPQTCPDTWRRRTVSGNLLAAISAETRGTTVLIDCITVWAANRLIALGDPETVGWDHGVEALETQLVDEITRILRWARQGKRNLVLVMNELPGEYPPSHPLGSAYQTVIDHLAQTIAEAVDGIYAVVAGVPYEVKRGTRLELL